MKVIKLITLFLVLSLLPLIDMITGIRLAEDFRVIFIYAILGIGLNVVTGFTGLLNLGTAAFMALGTYSFAILTAPIYPFQIGFWSGIVGATLITALVGLALGIPTLRLRGDYLAIVTLGFGEIVQDVLKNLESITKGTQGINPLPSPTLLGYKLLHLGYQPTYYLFLALLLIVVITVERLRHSNVGRRWLAIRDDELAASCMGINPVSTKLEAFAFSAALFGLAGALYGSYLQASGEPSNYDFQVSVIVLCIVIIGGLGSTYGVLFGAFIVVGFNSILLTKLGELIASLNSNNAQREISFFMNPLNFKYLLFGLALIVTMRLRPKGLFPETN